MSGVCFWSWLASWGTFARLVPRRGGDGLLDVNASAGVVDRAVGSTDQAMVLFLTHAVLRWAFAHACHRCPRPVARPHAERCLS